MTKEQYLKYVDDEDIYSILYDYYMNHEESKHDINRETFEEQFRMFLTIIQIRGFDVRLIFEKVVQHYNRKFKVGIEIDKYYNTIRAEWRT